MPIEIQYFSVKSILLFNLKYASLYDSPLFTFFASNASSDAVFITYGFSLLPFPLSNVSATLSDHFPCDEYEGIFSSILGVEAGVTDGVGFVDVSISSEPFTSHAKTGNLSDFTNALPKISVISAS